MRKILTLIMIVSSLAFAEGNLGYVLGVEKTRYYFAGLEYAKKWGIVIENSVFDQGVEKQYGRFAPYYLWNLPGGFSGAYTLYFGMQYDLDFYNFGARVDLQWTIHSRYLFANAVFELYYDSYLKDNVGFEIFVSSFLLKEVGVFGGYKNLPEYRRTERRYIAGLLFETGRIVVKPEISLPQNEDSSLMRTSVSFVYKDLF